MKTSWILSVLGSVLLTGAAFSQADKTSAVEKSVAALEQEWLRSQQTNDVDLLAPLLADHFVQTSGTGKVTRTKAAALADAKGTKWSTVTYGDLKVVVFGHTAVATGTFKGKRTDSSGKVLDENERFTDTWVKMPNGKWQCVASQDTPIKP